jgi:hypothetical protein
MPISSSQQLQLIQITLVVNISHKLPHKMEMPGWQTHRQHEITDLNLEQLAAHQTTFSLFYQ